MNTRTPSDFPRPATSYPPPHERARVLIVDDEPQILVALSDLLSPEFIVHTTSSPEQALQLACAKDEIAVVISDQRMPQMTGDDLFGHLSQRSRAERILVTGFADLTGVVRAVNEGRIFAYITKPWNADELQVKVHQAVEHFRLARELAHERQLLRDLMENVPDGVYFKDSELRFLRANAPSARMLDAPNSEGLVGRRLSEIATDKLGAEATEAEERRIVVQGVEVTDVVRGYGTPGARRWYSETKAPVRDAAGSVIGLVGISRDVTDRVEAENARQQQQQRIARLTRIHAMTSAINSAIVRIAKPEALLEEACRIAVREGSFGFAMIASFEAQDASFRLVKAVREGAEEPVPSSKVGSRLQQGTTLLERAIASQTPVVVNHMTNDDRASVSRDLCEIVERSAAAFPFSGTGAGRYVFALCSSQESFFDADEVRLLADVVDNISFALDHFATKAQLDFLAYYDELTGLPNQRLFFDRLTQQLATAKNAEKQLGVLMIDIDRFRQINETLGRRGGDTLLRLIAERMRGHVGAQDSLGRIEGNRFAILVPMVTDESNVASLVEGLLGGLVNDSFDIGSTEVLVSTRFGIALFPSDGSDAETLMSNAEAALKTAKSSGQRYVFYAPSMNSRVAERLSLETKLHRALENEEFVLHYQPKVALKDRAIVGLEALIRWQSPDQGMVPPGVFIPLLEETGFIVEVGRWVLMRAAEQYTEWLEAGKNPPRIAVNVSGIQLGQPDFLQSIESMKLTHEAAAANLDLEITESVFVEDFEGSVAKLTAVRQRGLRVAIDDFGTGYSSLAYLTRLPIDVIKVDRSFISRMTRDPQDMALVTTVIALSHALDCTVIAEGVEEPEQARLLRLLRCDQIQGYLVAKPLPAAEVCNMFSSPALPAWAQLL